MNTSFRKISLNSIRSDRKVNTFLAIWILLFFGNISFYVLNLSRDEHNQRLTFSSTNFTETLANVVDESQIKVKSSQDTVKSKSNSLLDSVSFKKPNKVLKRFTVLDANSRFRNVNNLNCNSSNIEIQIKTPSSLDNDPYDLVFYETRLPDFEISSPHRYTMVYSIESEIYSKGGDRWFEADFRMWYNLDLSFPEPVTYFEVRSFLASLISPPIVEFEQKRADASIVWVVSNCRAHNGRQTFMKELMAKMKVDSYGDCLKNKYNHPSEHMKNNVELFTKYKFVIAIENSNCVDYVTEKLVHAVASGSIPIVAGINGKPEYLKFMPRNSYINIFDYSSVDEFIKHLNVIQSDKREYEKYIYFKRGHSYNSIYLHNLDLQAIIELSKTHFRQFESSYETNNGEQLFFSELIAKEKSENKLCKIARYLKETPNDLLEYQIEQNRMNRIDKQDSCLPVSYIVNFFNLFSN